MRGKVHEGSGSFAGFVAEFCDDAFEFDMTCSQSLELVAVLGGDALEGLGIPDLVALTGLNPTRNLFNESFCGGSVVGEGLDLLRVVVGGADDLLPKGLEML